MTLKRNRLPQDENAERFVIGAMLHGYDDELLDSQHFINGGRAALFRAVLVLRGNGELVMPSSYDDPRVVDAAARENAQRTVGLIHQADSWPAADGPEHELQQCLDVVTQGALIDRYVGVLLDQWRRREVLRVSTRLQRAAYDSEDLAEALNGLDLKELANGAPYGRSHLLPVRVRMSDVQPEPVRWLWPERIARGKLTLLAGDPGLGKSFVTLDIAARVTQGKTWPDGGALDGAGGVVLLSAEDDPADTIRPRLDAAGADVDRISILQSVQYRDNETKAKRERSLCLQTDLDALEQAIRQTHECRLVVIDPITAYLGGTDSHKNADIRGLLAPLSQMAQQHSVAVVAVTHLNKAAGTSALYRAMGSLAFVAAARAVWLVVRDGDDPSGQRRLMIPAKNNIGNDRTGLSFELRSYNPTATVVAWGADPVEISADEALDPRDGRKDRESPVLEEATEWLQCQLADGQKPAKELKAMAEGDGLKWNSVQRAKKKLDVKTSRDGFGSDGAWNWSLPEIIDVESVAASMD